METICLEDIEPSVIDSLDYDEELNQISNNNDVINTEIDALSTDSENNLIAIENLYEVYMESINSKTLT